MLDRLEADLETLIDKRLSTLCHASNDRQELDSSAIGCAVHAVECAWDIVIPRRALGAIADRRQLVDACAAAIRRCRRLRARRRALSAPAASRVVLTPPAGRGGPVTQSGVLTEYAAEEVASSARRHGPGTRLEIIVPARSSEATIGELLERFAWLGEDDVSVSVTRSVAGG